MPTDMAILLTGTITPNVKPLVCKETEKRKQEYLRALNFYKNFATVYFLENSSYPVLSDPDFTSIENVHIKKFPVPEDSSQGKGYSEFEMIDKWILGEDDIPSRFVKVTGRYLIINFEKIFGECLKEKSDCIIIDQFKRMSAAFTCLFYIGTEYYKRHITNLYLMCNDDSKENYVEYVLYRRLLGSCVDSKYFATKPRYDGVSASSGGSIRESNLEYLIKSMMRKTNYFFSKRYIYLYG